MLVIFTSSQQSKQQQGFSVLELIVSLGLMGIICLYAASNLKELNDPVQNSTAELVGFIKQVRARAIATTSAYHIQPASSGSIVTTYSNTCLSTDTTTDTQLYLNLPSGTTFTDTDWYVCFNSRGLPDANLLISISGSSGTRTVEIFLGGAVKET